MLIIQEIFKESLSDNAKDITNVIGKTEAELPHKSKGIRQDPKLRSNSFYGRRDTLLKTVRKFRNDFPECDALVFGNWRLQVRYSFTIQSGRVLI